MDLNKKMSPDNPTQILTAHDLTQLRTLQHSVTTATVVAAAATAAAASTAFKPALASNLIQQNQQQHQQISAGSSANSAANNNNNISNLLAAATRATILNSPPSVSIAGSAFNASAMAATSKYVLLQQNRNGQITAYDGTTAAIGSNHNGGISTDNAGSSTSGNIVLLAAEPLDASSSDHHGSTAHLHQQLQQQQHHHHHHHHHQQQQQQHRMHSQSTVASSNDNDEELHSLAWLNNSNLIPDIVTTSAPTTSTSGSNTTSQNAMPSNSAKRALFTGNNICIVNATNAHDLIEELPHHVVGEEQVVATNVSSSASSGLVAPDLPPETQITTLSVSDFQQQFKRFSSADLKDAKSHAVYGNIAALGATTTVHVGPSGTTTVVEYKAGTNFLPARQILTSSNGVGNLTQLSATNLSNSNSSLVPSSASFCSSPSSTIVTTSSLSASSSSSLAANNTSTATLVVAASGSKQLTLPNATSIVANGNSCLANGNLATVTTNVSNTTNTLHQGHKIQQQQQQQVQQNNGATNSTTPSSINTSSSSTTHHPHKKYLREKMNVLDQGGGGSMNSATPNSNVSNVSSAVPTVTSSLSIASALGSTITVVSSPASSNTSLSSSLSTAAINGGSSPPLTKTSYFTLSGSSTPIALNYSSSNSSVNAPFIAVSSTSSSSSAISPSSLSTTGIPPGYTLVSHPALPLTTNPQISSVAAHHHQQHNIVVSSPNLMVSPDTQPQHATKEYYNLSTSQHLQHHYQQQQQQPHPHQAMRSPTSYSSYDNDSLKDFEISNSNSNISNQRMNGVTPQSAQQQQQSPLAPKSASSSSLTNSANTSSGSGSMVTTPQKQKHATKVPGTHDKPPYSFSSLIFMAIEGSQEKALPVKEIYAWIVQHFPYFKTASNGWKNSVRHNLSLNKSFVKVEKAPNMGKGSLWRVEQQQRQNLIQALNRSPLFQNSSADKINLKSPGGTVLTQNYTALDGSKVSAAAAAASSSHINSRFDPQLFPNLSKAFNDVPDDEYPSDYSTSKTSNNHSANQNAKFTNSCGTQGPTAHAAAADDSAIANNNPPSSVMGAFINYESIERLARDCGADSIDDVNAATAMLALKHGPKVFSETFQNGAPVITSSPSEDHTYSAGGSGGGSGSTADSGSSTPNLNGGSSFFISYTNGQSSSQHGCADNQSNCASSDAAYESSEECHNVTPEELEDRQRHRDGVDALLSLSLSSGIDTSSTTTNSQNSSLSSNSPIKRPPSTTVEEDHMSSIERNSMSNNSSSSIYTVTPQAQNMSKMALLSTAAANQSYVALNGNSRNAAGHSTSTSSLLDEGYNTQSNFGSSTTVNGSTTNGHVQQQQQQQQPQHHHQQHPHAHHQAATHHHLFMGTHNMHHHSLAATKKPKALRSLRTKIKRKVPWIR